MRMCLETQVAKVRFCFLVRSRNAAFLRARIAGEIRGKSSSMLLGGKKETISTNSDFPFLPTTLKLETEACRHSTIRFTSLQLKVMQHLEVFMLITVWGPRKQPTMFLSCALRCEIMEALEFLTAEPRDPVSCCCSTPESGTGLLWLGPL